MKMNFRTLVVIASGLLAGYLAGRGISGTVTTATATPDLAGLSTRSRSARDADSASSRRGVTSEEKHDFRSLFRSSLRYGSGNNDELRELERLDSSALRELIAGTAPGLGDGWDDDKRIPYTLLSEAAGVLYRREGDKSLEWAMGLEFSPAKRTIFFAMVEAAVTDSPASTKPWVDRFSETNGKGMSEDLACDAIISATGQGAEELLRVREAYGEDLVGFAFPQGSYAEDFDFQMLFDKIPSDSGMDLYDAMSYWAAKDRQSAWGKAKGEIERNGETSINYFGAIYTGMIVVEGEAGAADWAANHLAELPAGLRESALRKLIRYSRPDVSSEAVMDLLDFSMEARAKVNAALQELR